MKKPALFYAFCLAAFAFHGAHARAADASDNDIDAKERAARAAKLKAMGKKVKKDFQEAGQAIHHDAQVAGADIDAAWHKVENATVKGAENLADALKTLTAHAAKDMAHLGHNTFDFFKKSQLHLDVIRKGDSIAVMSCNSSLLKGPAKIGIGPGANCKTIANGTLKISDVKSCAANPSAKDSLAAGIFGHDMDTLQKKSQYEHQYFVMYDAKPEEFQAFLGHCQAKIAARAKPAVRKVATHVATPLAPPVQLAPAPEFKPVDHSLDPVVPPGEVNGTIGGKE